MLAQVSKVTAAAAAAEVQHASATSALKDNTSLLKALQKKLAQHDKQEGQHKTQVEEGTKQLRVLQEAAAAAQERLTAARQAAAAAAAEAAKPGADRAGSSAAAEETSALLRLQQQAREIEQQLQVLTARQVAAAAKATRAAKSVETLQQKADAAAAAAADTDQVLAAAQDDAQAAAAAVAASRGRSHAAEDKWRAAEEQQQSILVSVAFCAASEAQVSWKPWIVVSTSAFAWSLFSIHKHTLTLLHALLRAVVADEPAAPRRTRWKLLSSSRAGNSTTATTATTAPLAAGPHTTQQCSSLQPPVPAGSCLGSFTAGCATWCLLLTPPCSRQ
jgi:hypothetical protein